jgi:hypothetical protein
VRPPRPAQLTPTKGAFTGPSCRSLPLTRCCANVSRAEDRRPSRGRATFAIAGIRRREIEGIPMSQPYTYHPCPPNPGPHTCRKRLQMARFSIGAPGFEPGPREGLRPYPPQSRGLRSADVPWDRLGLSRRCRHGRRMPPRSGRPRQRRARSPRTAGSSRCACGPSTPAGCASARRRRRSASRTCGAGHGSGGGRARPP